MRRRVQELLGIGLAGAVVACCGLLPGRADATPASAGALGGVLHIAAGSCAAGTPAGSYLRMVLPSGSVDGPFLSNGDSTCPDQTYTPLAPGSDGGLGLGAYQPEPSPAFDASGNSLATAVLAPTRFYGIGFGISTNPVDPQTGLDASAPSLSVDDSGGVTGDLRSFAVSWNQQEFNQGAPKPDGTAPGNTTAVHGTFDAASGALTLDWASQVQGGPFDHFTGVWHIEGRVVGPTGAAAATIDQPSAAATATNAQAIEAAGQVPSLAGATATPGDVAAASPAAGASSGAANIGAVAAAAATRVPDDGWSAPRWLVVATALVGLAALAVYVLLDRVVRSATVR